MTGVQEVPDREGLAISVHGPAGVLDLAVPAGTAVAEVARAYAGQARLRTVPVLHTGLGRSLPPEVGLVEAGIATGDVLVATTGVRGAGADHDATPSAAATPSGTSAAWWCGVAAGSAVLAGWSATQAASTTLRTVTLQVLLLAVLLGVLPVGRLARQRALTTPVFAAAVAATATWDPSPERLPLLLGLAGLAAAVSAAVARTLAPEPDSVLVVWMAGGSAMFVCTGLAAVLGVPPQTQWAGLQLLALHAARYVPALAVDVPDGVLLDVGRSAATEAAPRDTGSARFVLRRSTVAAVAARGSRVVAAATAGILVVTAVAATMVLRSPGQPIDRIGAGGLVFFAGAGLLLAARSHRRTPARTLLRCAGLVCWAALAGVVLPTLSATGGRWLAASCVGLGAVVVGVAVATGRGWRSVWWGRRAELAETLSNVFAIVCLCLASGSFRFLWEITFTMFKP